MPALKCAFIEVHSREKEQEGVKGRTQHFALVKCAFTGFLNHSLPILAKE